MNEHLAFLRKLKSVSFATVEDNKPCIRIADVMIHENDVLYFLTAEGKPFYKQLKKNPNLSIIGMDKKHKTVRVSGEIEWLGKEYVDKIFDANPMMNDLYKGEKRYILDAFCMRKGEGEMFDLGVQPLHRETFSFGGASKRQAGFYITDECTSCGICKDECVTECISEGSPYKINSNRCLECGRCATFCPSQAIKEPRKI